MTNEKGAGRLPRPFFYARHDVLVSTNDEARRLAEGGEGRDLLVVHALDQTGGRGRRGRAWVGPPGNLMFSVLIDTSGNPFGAASLGLVAAVALAEAVDGLTGKARARCKWPNDVMAEGRKLAGMLLETADRGRWLILGIGVNVAHRPPDDQVETPAICLAELGFAGDMDRVLETFCHCFGPKIALWRSSGFASFQSRWVERAYGLGQTILVRLPDRTVTGTFAGLDADGTLLLSDAETGEMRRILAGDVFVGEGGRHASSH